MSRTIDDVRRTILSDLVVYIERLPAARQPVQVPHLEQLQDGTRLRHLGISNRENQLFARFLANRGRCQELPLLVTMPWATIADVVAAVIRYPGPNRPEDLHHPRD